MQFEFPLIFVRNFTCLLGKLQNKSMSLIGNSISPGKERPFFAHCAMHVYDIHIQYVGCCIHTCTCRSLFAIHVFKFSGFKQLCCTVAFLLGEAVQNSLHCSAVMTSRLVAVLSDKNCPLLHQHCIFPGTCYLTCDWLRPHVQNVSMNMSKLGYQMLHNFV